MVVEFDNARALQFLYRRLLVTHDAAGLFLAGKVNKLAEGEEQQVVSSHHQQIFVNLQLIESKQQVADGSETGVVGLRPVVDDGDGLGVVLLSGPRAEVVGKLVVGDDDVLVNLGNGVNVVEHAPEDGATANLQ